MCNEQTLESIQGSLQIIGEDTFDEDSFTGNTQTCMFCKFAIGQLDKMIEDKHNEEEIKEGLEKLCSYLPKNYADQCKAFVDTYTDIIIDMITKDATPEEVI